MAIRGISSFGAYIPRRRLSRSIIAQAHAWANPNLAGMASGSRAISGHDEDSLTMAVAAARYALQSAGRSEVRSLDFASTTLPFADRQNAALVGEAIGLGQNLRTQDSTGSLRAGVSALSAALERPAHGMIVAADKRLSRPGGGMELRFGDGAASFVVSTGDVLAEYVGAFSLSVDFTDHYRAAGESFDYMLEERWAREEGYNKLLPAAIKGVLERTNIPGDAIAHIILGHLGPRDAKALADRCGCTNAATGPDIHRECGETGTAHPLLALTSVLKTATPGDYILLAGYGQGAEAVILRATGDIAKCARMVSATEMVAEGEPDDNYLRYLSTAGLVELDWGMRAERDNRTAQSAFYRHRDTVTRFAGGRCTSCGAEQFPRTRVCVNPECRLTDTQITASFADKRGSVKSFTEDWLALSYSPPLMYGNVRFDGGGVAMLEFTDFGPGQMQVGDIIEMHFRIKDSDPKRAFKRYCWKAARPRLGNTQNLTGGKNG